jgi:ABC-type dipeptide/oligopeptide/nickel transport system permease component
MTPLRRIAERLVLTVPVVLSVVTLIFLVVRVLPGDPAQVALGENAARPAVEALRARLGLDAPLPLQDLRFLGDLARGDLGRSMINGTPVVDQIAYHLPFTLELTLVALLVGVGLGLPTGVWTDEERDRAQDYVGLVQWRGRV